ncbi:hypothetical protein N8V85_10635, partial [Enterobacter hormaechei subsp. hoffmannii]|nr:hypothetical protein [Enterobacter hormaechei subsp. hoffmannii]
GKNSLNRLIRCVCGKKIGPDPRNFNQRVSLGRNDLLIRTFPNILHSDVLWLISGNEQCGEFTEPTSIITSNQLNSWSADIGNCRMALSNAMDCMPPELSAIGTLTIVYEKLDDLQETICKQADKI